MSPSTSIDDVNGSQPTRPLDADPRVWSEGELSHWLSTRGLPADIVHAFEVHLVNGLLAEDLAEEDLIAMGIEDTLHQRRVILELRQLFSGDCKLGRSFPPAIAANSDAGSACPVAPTAPQRTRPRPQSARSYSSQSSATNLHAKAPSPLEGRGLSKTQTIAQWSVISKTGSSPYKQAVPGPRRPRPRSASAASRAARDVERFGAETSRDGIVARGLPRAPLPQTGHAGLRRMPSPYAQHSEVGMPPTPITPSSSSTALPREEQYAQRHRIVPPLPSSTAPQSRKVLPPSGLSHELLRPETSVERDQRLGLQALRASRERLGARCETATPPLASASTTPVRSCQPEAVDSDLKPSEKATFSQSSSNTAEAPTVSTSCQDGIKDKDPNQILALGGHASVSDLLYERDCLAAALAAEQRRSAEFQQLWQRAEEDLQKLRTANVSPPAPPQPQPELQFSAAQQAQLQQLVASVLSEKLLQSGIQSGQSLISIAPPAPVPPEVTQVTEPPVTTMRQNDGPEFVSPARSISEAPYEQRLPQSADALPTHAQPAADSFKLPRPTVAHSEEVYIDSAENGLVAPAVSAARPTCGTGSAVQLDNLCHEFRLQVRDMVQTKTM